MERPEALPVSEDERTIIRALGAVIPPSDQDGWSFIRSLQTATHLRDRQRRTLLLLRWLYRNWVLSRTPGLAEGRAIAAEEL